MLILHRHIFFVIIIVDILGCLVEFFSLPIAAKSLGWTELKCEHMFKIFPLYVPCKSFSATTTDYFGLLSFDFLNVLVIFSGKSKVLPDLTGSSFQGN